MNKDQDTASEKIDLPPDEIIKNAEPDFHGAAIIDEDGKETEITEEMIRKAIHELDEEVYPELGEPESK